MVSMVSIQQKCCQKTTKNACFCIIFPFFHFIALHNYPQGIHAGVHGRFFAVYSHLQSPIASMEISRRSGHRIFSQYGEPFATPTLRSLMTLEPEFVALSSNTMKKFTGQP